MTYLCLTIDLKRYPCLSQLIPYMESAEFNEIVEDVVRFGYELNDIQAYRSKAFSVSRLISEEAFQHGIQRMEGDLRKGRISCVSSYLQLWGTK